MRLPKGPWLVLLLALTAACRTSVAPSPDPAPGPSNAPPVVTAVTASVTATEAADEVTFTATVTDAETPPNQLIYEWAADQGIIVGMGTTARWMPPTDRPTPADYRVRLTVVERYGMPQQEHRVSADSPPVRVYDSPRELRELSLTFLRDFADSSVSARHCVRNFSDNCSGKADELEDIERNRREYLNLAHVLGTPSVAIDAGRTSAQILVSCEFLARDVATGVEGWARGTCRLTAVRENFQWWLCSSRFDSPTSLLPRFVF